MDKTLNKEQTSAIKHKTGPLLIIAGAGTGKTTVITERVKYLIEKKLAKPHEILALTFTEKAAREMETRIDEALPYGYTQMWVMTFHSFCDRVLRSEALHIGMDPRFRLMSEANTTQLLRNNLFKLELDYFRPLGNPTKFIGGILQHFSRLQDEDITPQEYMKYAVKLKKSKTPKLQESDKLEIKKTHELAKAYKAYDELKVKEGVLDFGDLITKTLKLFRDRTNILEVYQNKFKYILIDEFQDTNFAQNELAMLLAKSHKNITVVGDDDQSVYRFRGAAISNIIQFRKNYKKAKVIVLTKNYRSTQKILDRSYDLVQFNNPDRLEVTEKVNKKLVSTRPELGVDVKFLHSDRVENEADTVAREIKKLHGEGFEWKDFAILVRANTHGEPFTRALNRNGVPYQFLGPGRLFKQPEIIDLISYLRVLYDFDDSVSFYRLLSVDYFDISPRDLIKISNYAKKQNLSIFEAAEKIEGIAVSKDTEEKIKKLTALISEQFKSIKLSSAGQLLYNFLESSGLLEDLVNPNSVEATKKANNISKFFDKLKSYETDHEDASITAVVDWIDLAQEIGESPLAADSDWTEVDAVNILTVHSAKGLEFPVVFLVNLVSQRFPTIERREQIPIPDDLIKEILPKGDYHLEEERRLFYVGMTRAKDRLYFTAADFYGEGKREKKISPFIHEALGDDLVINNLDEDKSEQLTFLDYGNTNKTRDLVEKVKVTYLSYSQIDTFKMCPLHYKLKYILKIPTEPSGAMSFGTAIHGALKDLYEEVGIGKKPTEKSVEKLLLRNWVHDGFKTKKHETEYLNRGKKYLSGFLKSGFDPKVVPTKLEEKFTIPLKGLAIGGIIDRVDVRPGGVVEIIDYKTSEKIPSQKEVDKNLQLSMYAMAAATIKESPFGVDPENIRLSLYFLDQQVKITTTRTARQLENAVKEILKVKTQIEESDFKCSGSPLCESCEYKLFCRDES